MIKTIIFDYGGVIGNDPTNYIFRAVSKTFKIDIKKIRDEFLKNIFLLKTSQKSEREFWRKFSESLHISDYKKLQELWIAEFKKHTKIDKKLLSLIRGLKNQYKLCLLSNRAIFYRKISITKLLKRIFPIIIYSFEVKMRKPDRKIYLYTLKKLKSKPHECLIVDDNKTNLFCPQELGMKTIHFKSFLQFKKEFISKLNSEN